MKFPFKISWRKQPTPAERFIMDFASCEGYFTLQEGFLAHHLAGRLTRGCIIEIGSWQGRSTVAWALGLRDATRGLQVYAIDRQHHENFDKNIARLRLEKQVVKVQGLSVSVAETWKQAAELIFIDGGHDYEMVKADFKAWLPYLMPGGYMVLHDAGGFWPGPTKVFGEEIMGRPDKWTNVHVVDSAAFAQREPAVKEEYYCPWVADELQHSH